MWGFCLWVEELNCVLDISIFHKTKNEKHSSVASLCKSIIMVNEKWIVVVCNKTIVTLLMFCFNCAVSHILGYGS